MVKNPPTNEGDVGLIPGLGKSPGGGNGNPLWYSRLGNPMDRGAWWATVIGVTNSQTWLSTHTHAIRLEGLVSFIRQWHALQTYEDCPCLPHQTGRAFSSIKHSGHNEHQFYPLVRLPEEHFANGHDFFLKKTTQISRVKSEKFPIKTQLGFFTVKLLNALNTMTHFEKMPKSSAW